MIRCCRLTVNCRSYSRQSVRTGLLPANALSAYWYRQGFRLYLTFAKFPVPRRIMLHSSMSKTVHAPLSQRMRLPVSCGQVGDLIARSRFGFEVRSVQKDLGSVGRLPDGDLTLTDLSIHVDPTIQAVSTGFGQLIGNGAFFFECISCCLFSCIF
jgi:hypothetical protein